MPPLAPSLTSSTLTLRQHVTPSDSPRVGIDWPSCSTTSTTTSSEVLSVHGGLWMALASVSPRTENAGMSGGRHEPKGVFIEAGLSLRASSWPTPPSRHGKACTWACRPRIQAASTGIGLCDAQDDVDAAVALDKRAQLADLEREGRLLERRCHLAAPEHAQVPAALGAASARRALDGWRWFRPQCVPHWCAPAAVALLLGDLLEQLAQAL